MPRKKTEEPYERPAADSPSYPVTTIAKLLMITERRVQQLSKEGVIPRTQHGRYELAPAVQGYVRYLQERSLGRPSAPTDYHAEKSRLVKMQADRAEYELKTMAGELVRVDDIKSQWYQVVTDCKSRLLSISSKAAPVVASESSAAQCQIIIDDLVRETLQELSQYGDSERQDDNPIGDESVEPAA